MNNARHIQLLSLYRAREESATGRMGTWFDEECKIRGKRKGGTHMPSAFEAQKTTTVHGAVRFGERFGKLASNPASDVFANLCSSDVLRAPQLL
jgi:hypothetical protein